MLLRSVRDQVENPETGHDVHAGRRCAKTDHSVCQGPDLSRKWDKPHSPPPGFTTSHVQKANGLLYQTHTCEKTTNGENDTRGSSFFLYTKLLLCLKRFSFQSKIKAFPSKYE